MMRRRKEGEGKESVPLQHQALPRRNTYENPTSLSWTPAMQPSSCRGKAASEILKENMFSFRPPSPEILHVCFSFTRTASA